jgi:predicted O-methyltransferase YrrM
MARFQPETDASRTADAVADQGIAAWRQNRIDEARQLLDQAAALDEDCLKAHLALSQLRFPGMHYLDVLGHIHAALRPRTYIEIGVCTGASMVRALPTTRCIGVDPEPALASPLGPNVEMCTSTSNAFFATTDIGKFLDGQPLDLGFIDGMHLFENVLEDFAHLERYCGPQSVIVLHDCLPIKPVTAERERRTRFWTGDVWRFLPTLAHFRPDLIISVIGCVPSGLAVVRGLDPTSDVLDRRRDEALAFGFGLPFTATEDHATRGIRSVLAKWDAIAPILA